MKWSKLKSRVEAVFADSLKGRLRLHTTGYRGYTSDDVGRAWITFDGEEIFNMPAILYRYGWELENADNESRLGQSRLYYGMREYLDLSIEAITSSENSVIRALGMLDRRFGKRRLATIDVKDEPPLVRYLYLVRCEADRVRPNLPDEAEHLRAHLTERNVMATQWKAENQDRLLQRDRAADEAMSHSRKHNLAALLPQIHAGDVSVEELRTDIARTIHSAFTEAHDPDALLLLLTHVLTSSKLLNSDQYVTGVTSLAVGARHWVRPIEQWRPRSRNADRQFSQLARHLWARYQVPEFMDQAWINGTQTQQSWFRHIGHGHNIRTADALPINLTKKMAHHFCHAPPTYSIFEAFRFAQVHAFGGDRHLCDALCGTRLSREFCDDDFWISVLRFFIANPMLDYIHVNPIIDYIRAQRFEPVVEFVERGVAEERPPAQPNFSMQGRTVDSLLRAVNAWHRRLGRDEQAETLQWEKSDVKDYTFQEGAEEVVNHRTWQIRELVSSEELVAEGRRMDHCVASCAASCFRGTCSIWTMEVLTSDGLHPRLTIELEVRSNEIRQVRGKRNRLADDAEMAVIRRWADSHGLSISSYL